jgi:hypothetical protein
MLLKQFRLVFAYYSLIKLLKHLFLIVFTMSVAQFNCIL